MNCPWAERGERHMRKGFRMHWRRKGQRQTRQRRGEEGQSILEMAFALPMLVLILIAVVDLARAFDAYVVLTNAVREGARFGSRDASLSTSDIQQLVVEDVLGSGTNITNMGDITDSNVTAEIGTDAVTVTVTYDFGLWFGGIVGMDTIELEKVSVMPVMSSP